MPGTLPPLTSEAYAMSPTPDPATDAYAEARAALVAEVARDVVMTRRYLGTDTLSPAVMEALGRVRREQFVPEGLRGQAYRNHPLPIGGGQTISQPYIVAIMSHLLAVGPGDRVYELGTGSGYQAAVLGAMGIEVYSIEIVPELAERARQTLARLGYDNVHVRAGDGYAGWPEAAPFDGIIITAAGPELPEPLLDQLKTGGRLVMPVGEAGGDQVLVVVTKHADGSLSRRPVLPVRFVPITGDGVD
jgi:protein-L-isoaspartate(D-aspartate) O-methyltransferase